MTAPRYAAECLTEPVMQLRGQALVDTMHCVKETLTARRLNPVAAARCQRLLRELEKGYFALVSPQRQDRVVSNPPLGEWNCQDGATEWITTHEAAQLLGCHVRTVQRLARAIGVRRGSRWVLSHSAVLAHKAIRDEENEDDSRAAA